MALRADHAHLARPSQPTDGRRPDARPRFLTAYADWLARKRDAEEAAGGKPHAHDTRLRHSDAGKCARAIALDLAGVPREPMDAAGLHVVELGQMIHELVQERLADEYGDDVECEVRCQIDGLDASGHVDAVITQHRDVSEVPYQDLAMDTGSNTEERRIAYELKSVGGYGYKSAVGAAGPAEGPRYTAVRQGALNALAIDADELVIGMVATEAISQPQARRAGGLDEVARWAAEFTYSREEWEPIARSEQARLQRILDLYDDGLLAPRAIPDPQIPHGALIADPTTGAWQHTDEHGQVLDVGQAWQCGYCPHQATCAGLGAGYEPVSRVQAGEAGDAA